MEERVRWNTANWLKRTIKNAIISMKAAIPAKLIFLMTLSKSCLCLTAYQENKPPILNPSKQVGVSTSTVTSVVVKSCANIILEPETY